MCCYEHDVVKFISLLLVLYCIDRNRKRSIEVVGVAAIKKSIGGDDNVQFIHFIV